MRVKIKLYRGDKFSTEWIKFKTYKQCLNDIAYIINSGHYITSIHKY